MFIPMGIYVGETEGIPIVFDSGCLVAVTPNKGYLCGEITSVNKS